MYQNKNYSKIDFSSFIKWQTKRLFFQHTTGIANIHLKREIDGVYLDIDHAIPCGLIIQELVSNALNHAFPKEREGDVVVQMKAKRCCPTQLIIKDNGIGLPAGVDFSRAKTLGFRLVKDFVKQIEGTIDLKTSPGTQFTISF